MKKRYESLDVLRGLTVAFMCVVNNPGSWAHIFPPLRHAEWVGCTPTDLVYPFFVFCMGCAMAFSFSKYDTVTARAYLKVLKRGALIFLVGFALNLYPFFPTSPHDGTWTFWQNYLYWFQHKRVFGVLQRIGMAYAIAGCLALWLRKPGRIGAAIAALCMAYTGILLLFGRDPGAFTLEGNVSMRVDTWLVGGDHCYHGYGGTDFDPEGLLGSMTSACSCLLGYLIGTLILSSRMNMSMNIPASVTSASSAAAPSARNASAPTSFAAAPVSEDSAVAFVPAASSVLDSSSYAASISEDSAVASVPADFTPDRVVNRIFVYGCLSLILGTVLGIWIPICKPLWSVSYVFFAGGWAMLALAFLAYLIDIKGHGKPFEPFKAMGMNALTAFVLAGVLAKSYGFFGFAPSRFFGANEYMSLLWALIFVSVIFCILWVLYKKKIVIKL